VRKKAVKPIFAVAHVKVNARVVASLDVNLATLRLPWAFINCEILISTKLFDAVKFAFEALKFEKLFVVHLLNLI